MPGSQFVRRQLGNRLVAARLDAHKTQADVGANKGMMSESKLYKIENGMQAIKAQDVWSLCRFYDTPKEVVDALVTMADLTSTDAVWEENPDVMPGWFSMYAGLESACSHLFAYHAELVLGVLQIPQYARAVIDLDGVLDEEVLTTRLKLREERQEAIINRDDRRVSMVLGPGVFDLEIGSPEVMADQRAHLIHLNSMNGFDIRVLPKGTAAHPGVNGPFTLLDFENPLDPSVVYLEYLAGARYLETAHHVQAYRTAFASLMRLSVPIEEYS